MSGRLPYHVLEGTNYVSGGMNMLPAKLKQIGYATHQVGSGPARAPPAPRLPPLLSPPSSPLSPSVQRHMRARTRTPEAANRVSILFPAQAPAARAQRRLRPHACRGAPGAPDGFGVDTRPRRRRWLVTRWAAGGQVAPGRHHAVDDAARPWVRHELRVPGGWGGPLHTHDRRRRVRVPRDGPLADSRAGVPRQRNVRARGVPHVPSDPPPEPSRAEPTAGPMGAGPVGRVHVHVSRPACPGRAHRCPAHEQICVGCVQSSCTVMHVSCSLIHRSVCGHALPWRVPHARCSRYAAYLYNAEVLRVRAMSRSIPPPWRSIRFRLVLRTYAPWGVRVVSQTKSRKIPTRKILPHFLVIRY